MQTAMDVELLGGICIVILSIALPMINLSVTFSVTLNNS